MFEEIPSYQEQIHQITAFSNFEKQQIITTATNKKIVDLQKISEIHHCVEMLYLGADFTPAQVNKFMTTVHKPLKRSPMNLIKNGKFDILSDQMDEMFDDED